jgi:hypothetical protein
MEPSFFLSLSLYYAAVKDTAAGAMIPRMDVMVVPLDNPNKTNNKHTKQSFFAIQNFFQKLLEICPLGIRRRD